MPSQVFNRHYWSARELVVLGVFSAAAKLSLLVALVGGGMNPVSLLAKNLIFTTLLVVMLYKVRKPGTLALFVLVNMLISMLLLGGSVTLAGAQGGTAAAGTELTAHAAGGGLRRGGDGLLRRDAEAVGARARRRGIRSHVESLFAVRFVAVHARESGLVVCHRPHCGHRLRGIAVRAFFRRPRRSGAASCRHCP